MVLKSIIFVVKSFLGNFYKHLAIFSGHTGFGGILVLSKIKSLTSLFWCLNRIKNDATFKQKIYTKTVYCFLNALSWTKQSEWANIVSEKVEKNRV